MTIKGLYEIVEGLPKTVNIIDKEGNHWIGKYENVPDELLISKFTRAYLHHLDSEVYNQIIFYI